MAWTRTATGLFLLTEAAERLARDSQEVVAALGTELADKRAAQETREALNAVLEAADRGECMNVVVFRTHAPLAARASAAK